VTDVDDVNRWSALPEGQFFERKSAIDRSGGSLKRRKATEVARDIAETLCAMANADGGELVVGMEDDGTPTGVPHPADRVELLLRAAGERSYVEPPLRFQRRELQTQDGLLLLHFAVEWSPEVHHLANGRYVLRVGDSTMPFPAEQIAALKSTKWQGLIERSFPPGATLDDLDLELVATLTPDLVDAGVPVEWLQHHRLVEGRNGRFVPNLAALLLFGKDPGRWHPRCGIDFVRWEGNERKYGAELNIEKRIRIERPLATLIKDAFEAIRPFIRERQQLVGLFFTERLEYPDFVWQEAIVNAVAHRDYGIQGAPIEVWMFDDHIEVRSPGLPPPPVTVEALNRRQRLHLSRSPLIVRTLVELGFMGDLGEGIPRMFDVMEQEGFYPPTFASIGALSVEVTLRNQPIYDRATLEWLQQFKEFDLSGDQRRLLAYARAQGGTFTSREYQKLVGIDLYVASNSIKALIRKGLVRSTAKGGRVYQIVESHLAPEPPPEELSRILDALGRPRILTNQQIQRTLGVSRATASRYLRDWAAAGWLHPSGSGRGRSYEPTPQLNASR